MFSSIAMFDCRRCQLMLFFPKMLKSLRTVLDSENHDSPEEWHGMEMNGVFSPNFLGKPSRLRVGSESAPSFGHTAPLRQRPRALAGNEATVGHGTTAQAVGSTAAPRNRRRRRTPCWWGSCERPEAEIPWKIPWKILLESQSTLW